MTEFVEKLNFPEVPLELCQQVLDHITNTPPVWGTDHFISYTCPDNVVKWVLENVFPDQDDMIVKIQIIRPGIAIHVDKREAAFNFLIDKGSGRPVTSFWKDTERGWQVIDSYELEEKCWYKLNTSVPHNVSNFYGDRITVSAEKKPTELVAHKLNLNDDVKKEIVDMLLTIKDTVEQVEKIEPNRIFWSVEGAGGHTFVDYGGVDKHKKIEKATWKYLSENIPNLNEFMKKYNLFDFYTMIANHNFVPHKHSVNQDATYGIWFIAYIENHIGELLFVDPINYKDPCVDVVNENNTYYLELPPEVTYKTTLNIKAEPGDLIILNTWKWHTYITQNPNARTLTVCINPCNISNYIDMLEGHFVSTFGYD